MKQKTHFVWIFFVLWAEYFVRESILQLHSINLYWNNFVPNKTTHVSICCLANPYDENHTHSSHFFQCPSEKPCTEEKRFPKKILDPPQLLSSSLNITQEGCEKLHRVQAQGSIVQGKERCYIFSILNPLTKDTFCGLLSVCTNGVWLYHKNLYNWKSSGAVFLSYNPLVSGGR